MMWVTFDEGMTVKKLTRRLVLAVAVVSSVLALYIAAILVWLTNDPFISGNSIFASAIELSDWAPALAFGGVAVASWSVYVGLSRRNTRSDASGDRSRQGLMNER